MPGSGVSMNRRDIFQFRDAAAAEQFPDGFFVVLPVGITTKNDLFEILKRALAFPLYCGSNWDAIDECLGNFDWVQEYEIIISHAGVPKISDLDLKIYIDILQYRVEDWKSNGAHKFTVIFRTEDRSIVEAALL
jgi:hypothetical protein